MCNRRYAHRLCNTASNGVRSATTSIRRRVAPSKYLQFWRWPKRAIVAPSPSFGQSSSRTVPALCTIDKTRVEHSLEVLKTFRDTSLGLPVVVVRDRHRNHLLRLTPTTLFSCATAAHSFNCTERRKRVLLSARRNRHWHFPHLSFQHVQHVSHRTPPRQVLHLTTTAVTWMCLLLVPDLLDSVLQSVSTRSWVHSTCGQRMRTNSKPRMAPRGSLSTPTRFPAVLPRLT
jgi:hypothetical protein